MQKQKLVINVINPFSVGTVFRRQNLTSTDIRFWRLKMVPTMKELQWAKTRNKGIQMKRKGLAYN